MKLFIEKYPYKSEVAKDLLKDFDPYYTKDGKVTTDFVGYCYDKEEQDCIFILPKVVCDQNDTVFGKDPNDIADIQNCLLEDDYKDFLENLGIWIYRALNEYSKHNPATKALRKKSFSELGGADSTKGSYLDVLLSLKAFYEENRDFFLFTMKNIHSQHHKINWQNTIAHSPVIFQGNVPIYINPVSRRKEIDWDEELLTIFFSILQYMNKFGFDISIDLNYDITKGEKFEAYRSGLGAAKLRQIKHKYFSDTSRKLWSLCYSFFEKEEEIKSSKQRTDYLMATSFHVVFESMVDTLIGDPEYDSLKKLGDGKIIDHIYKYGSVLSPDQLFYIGDSKYYGVGTSPSEDSKDVFKQFSYARTVVNNTIRDNIDSIWPYRDNLTEGYAVIPNFFISANTDPKLRYEYDGMDAITNPDIVKYNFKVFANRLFDRDTLWVRQYNLNFLYLLSVYASADEGAQATFKAKARRFFKGGTIDLLNRMYEFFILSPKSGTLESAMTDSIKWGLRGMCYRTGENSEQLLLALEKPGLLQPATEKTGEYVSLLKEDYRRIKPIVETSFNCLRCELSGIDSAPLREIDNIGGKFYYFVNNDCLSENKEST